MPIELSDLLPDPSALLQLEPEELAGVVIEYFNHENVNMSHLNPYNFGLPNIVQGYPREKQNEISNALMEAWMWLEKEVLIARKPGGVGNFYFVTRRGSRLRTRSDLTAYRNANLLPRTLLHPVLAEKIWSSFLRGEYDTAVFQSFREVEIAVRRAGRYDSTDLGVDLMTKAFKAENGPLADRTQPVSEQEALMHLFRGAIGYYKNPTSHRTTSINSVEAVEIITFASHLLKIVDSRITSP